MLFCRKQGHNIPEKRPRIQKQRYVGDVNLIDFENPERIKHHWNLALNSIKNLRKKKVLTRKCQRYKTKIETLNSLITHLEKNQFISDDVGQMLNVCI